VSRNLTATLVAAIVGLGLGSVAAPASADTAGCVTRAEFGNVSRGDSIAKVTRVFDTRGTITGQSDGYQTRSYRTCRRPQQGAVHIGYDRKRLSYKHAMWG
jgi:hypothetical protein